MPYNTCSRCGVTYYDLAKYVTESKHECPPAWEVADEDKEVIGVYYAYDVDQAVEKGAEEYHSDACGECPEQFELYARSEGLGEWVKFSVGVDYEPTFNVRQTD